MTRDDAHFYPEYVLPPVLALARVVARQVDLLTHHEVHLLPTLMVGRTVSRVALRGSQPPRVLVRRSIHAAPRVIILRPLRQVQDTVLVPHPAEQHVGMLQVLVADDSKKTLSA